VWAAAAMPVGLVTVIAIVLWTNWATPWQLVVGGGAAFCTCLTGRLVTSRAG